MFAEAAYSGIGFGLGFAVTIHPAQTLIAGSPGEDTNWGGAATTSFFIDPAEELITIFMTQVRRRAPIRCGASCAPWSTLPSPTSNL